MTPEQRSDFEHRIIRRAFEAGVCGCAADPVVCAVADEIGLGESLEYEEWQALFKSLVERGILRKEGAIPADYLALSYEEWGRRIALLSTRPYTTHERTLFAKKIAKALRGKAIT